MSKLHQHPFNPGLLVVRENRQTMVPLLKSVTSIGRKQTDIVLDDAKVSSRHAEVRIEGKNVVLVDLKSTNGTFVNQGPVKKVNLKDQDVIEIGSVTLSYFHNREDLPQELQKTHNDRPEERSENKSVKGTVVTTTQTLLQLVVQFKVTGGPSAGKEYRFKKSHITVGRNDADIVLLDPDVSRAHALVEVLGQNSVFVRDLGSTNGTYLHDRKVQTEKLSSGDEIVVGNSKMKILFETPLEAK